MEEGEGEEERVEEGKGRRRGWRKVRGGGEGGGRGMRGKKGGEGEKGHISDGVGAPHCVDQGILS